MWAVSLCVWAATLSGAPTILTPAQVAGEYSQRSWFPEDGLPDKRVWAILQTRDGYLWIGTQRGLARFDGRKFTVYDHDNTPELADDDCHCLAEDADGSVWIGTYNTLVHKIGDRFLQVLPDAAGKRWVHTSSLSLCASRFGGVWVGSDDSLARIDARGIKAYELNPTLHRTPVVALEEDAVGRLWIGTWEGLWRLDPKDGQLEPATVPAGFEQRPAVTFGRGALGERWVLFTEHAPYRDMPNNPAWLACFKDGQWGRTPRPGQPDVNLDAGARFLTPDQFGELWLPPGQPNGLCRFVHGEFQFVPMPHLGQQDSVLAAETDREGNLWVGTSNSGLQRWIPRQITTYTTNDGLADDSVWTLCEARDGSVWLGTDGGVSRFQNGRFTNYTPHEGLSRKEARAVAEEADGTVWVGTLNGLDSIRDGKITQHRLPGEWFETKIRTLLAARDGALWIGTVRGLTRLDHGQRTQYTPADGLGSSEPRALLEDRAGDLWIGTLGGGLSRFHAGKFTTLTTTNGLSSNNVWALHEDAGGGLWIGTENGLDRWQDGRLTAFTTREGLPVNGVNGILEDDFGRLWISHDHGLYWVWKRQLNDVASGRTNTVGAVRYDDSDGLLTTEFNGQKSNPTGCRTRDGRLWFATAKGVAVIDPVKVALDEVPPLTVIEHVRANGKVAFDNGPETESIVPSPKSKVGVTAASLTPPASRNTDAHSALRPSPSAMLRFAPGSARILEFRYTANTFAAPEKARFRYRLLGLDEHWIEAGARRAAYFTGLRPGDYEFEVIAANHHGVWPVRGATLAFTVEPFLYQTGWFYLVCGLAVSGAGFGLVRWRLHELRQIHRLERLHELDQQRQRIARDIHDDLGASLTQILQVTEESRARSGQSAPADAPTRRIASLAEEAVAHLGEIVWANNPKYDTLEDLVAYLREFAAQYFQLTSVRVQLDFPEAVPARPVTGLFRRHLLLLTKEALQNVAKHAGASRVALRLALAGDQLELSVADNGRGLPGKGETPFGNGLTNMRQRVAELGGAFDLKSQPGNGAEIRIVVPLPAV